MRAICESPQNGLSQTCNSQFLAPPPPPRSAIRKNGVQIGNPETIRENETIRANLRIDSRESAHPSLQNMCSILAQTFSASNVCFIRRSRPRQHLKHHFWATFDGQSTKIGGNYQNYPKQLKKNAQFRISRFLEIARGCSRSLEVARGCSRLLEVCSRFARGCSRLLEVCSRFARGCSRLLEVARGLFFEDRSIRINFENFCFMLHNFPGFCQN